VQRLYRYHVYIDNDHKGDVTRILDDALCAAPALAGDDDTAAADDTAADDGAAPVTANATSVGRAPPLPADSGRATVTLFSHSGRETS